MKFDMQSAADLIRLAAIQLPDDVMDRLHELSGQETDTRAKAIYQSMFENQQLACRQLRPTCQDTGIIHFYIRAGTESPLLPSLEDTLRQAAALATSRTPLRPNTVDIFTDRNYGNNLGRDVPFIEWELVPGRDVQLTVYLAGGGCSLAGKSAVLMPSAGLDGVADFVLSAVCERGVNACPPLTVGVGIGPCITVATKLSKQALLRGMNTENPDPGAAQLEKKLYEALTALHIGPQGLGGDTGILAAHVEAACRHPATLGVSVSIGCWVHRRAVMKIDGSGEAVILSHRKPVAL